jgi:hypothetical protein
MGGAVNGFWVKIRSWFHSWRCESDDEIVCVRLGTEDFCDPGCIDPVCVVFA